MNTIYVTRRQWRGRALGGELDRAVGDTGRIAVPRLPGEGLWGGEGKVIDLAAWKAENLVELEGLEDADGAGSGLAQYEGRELVRRRRRKDHAALTLAELAATLSVVGAMAAIILRVLLF